MNSEMSPRRCSARSRSAAVGASAAAGEQVHQRGHARPGGHAFVEMLGAREQRQHVDDVLLGLALDRQALMRQRALQRVAEVFRQARHREHRALATLVLHAHTSWVTRNRH